MSESNTSNTTQPATKTSRTLRWVALVWFALGLVLLGITLVRLQIDGNKARANALPIYETIPNFDLVDSGGEPFSTEELRGKVWVASLFFTHCAAACPMMAKELVGFQRAVDNPNVVLVSISVDPERDTPERLREYAEVVGATPERWRFLTGDLDAIVDLAENHLKLGTGQARENFSSHPQPEAVVEELLDATEAALLDDDDWEWDLGEEEIERDPNREVEVVDPILHSNRFVLIDGQSRIRGYYDGLDEGEVELLREHARRLLKQEGL